MSFFLGNQGLALRSQYASLTFSDLSGATSQSTSVLWAYLGRGARYMFLDNTTNADVSIWLVSKDNPDQVSASSRLFFLELPQNRVINFDFLQQIQVEVDPGTSVYVSVSPGQSAPTSGKLRLTSFA